MADPLGDLTRVGVAIWLDDVSRAGLAGSPRCLAERISITVILILSRCRLLEVMDAFLDGIDLSRANGQDLSRMAAVGSIFVSRVDTEIDRRLDAIGLVEANVLRGTAATGNARPAFHTGVVMAALSRTAASPTTRRCTSSNATAPMTFQTSWAALTDILEGKLAAAKRGGKRDDHP